MKTLPIVWKRLVKEGETCPRCESTQQSVVSAISRLEVALPPLGIQPTLETQAIDDRTFRASPPESNRIWIAGKPMEQWLGASVGKSPCCTVCGDLPCRTMEVEGSIYEVIPAELIIKAAMIAASTMVGAGATAATRSACCSKTCSCD
jgi:Domain of unknown function (DUF2703)